MRIPSLQRRFFTHQAECAEHLLPPCLLRSRSYQAGRAMRAAVCFIIPQRRRAVNKQHGNGNSEKPLTLFDLKKPDAPAGAPGCVWNTANSDLHDRLRGGKCRRSDSIISSVCQ